MTIAMEMNELIRQCLSAGHVFLYGASVHGRNASEYLKANKAPVDGFIVSSYGTQARTIDGIPVYELHSVDWPASFIVLLSLSERFQEEVTNSLKESGVSEQRILPLSAVTLARMNEWLINEKRLSVLTEAQGEINERGHDCQEQIEKLLSEYDSILIRNMDVRSLGPMGSWKFYCDERVQCGNDGVYHLYYPVGVGRPLSSPNDFLLGKMKARGISVISRDTVDFWRLVIRQYPERIIWDDQFLAAGFSNVAESDFEGVDSPLIELTEDEERQGRIQANRLGVAGEYICFSCRDSGYWLDDAGYRPTETFIGRFRNASIDNYHEAVKYLRSQGVLAVRMGAGVTKPFEAEGAIDYANLGYSDFMDVYLTEHCKFFVCNLSGITVFPTLLAKPVLIVNAALLTTRCDAVPCFSPKRDFAIIKKFWSKGKKRYLSLKEILRYEQKGKEVDSVFPNGIFRLYADEGIEVIENSPAEIVQAVWEMNERINGTYVETEADKVLYRRYLEIIKNAGLGDSVPSNWRLCAGYLRENEWLLEEQEVL